MAINYSATLATTASSTMAATSPVYWPGGMGTFMVTGTFYSGTITLQVLGPDNSTWLSVGADTTKTAPGLGNFSLPPGSLRINPTGWVSFAPLIAANVARVLL